MERKETGDGGTGTWWEQEMDGRSWGWGRENGHGGTTRGGSGWNETRGSTRPQEKDVPGGEPGDGEREGRNRKWIEQLHEQLQACDQVRMRMSSEQRMEPTMRRRHHL